MDSSSSASKATVKVVIINGTKLLFVALSEERTVVCYDFDSKAKLMEYSGHSLTISAIDVDVESQLLVSGSSDSTVRTWKICSGAQLRKFSHNSVVTGLFVRESVLVSAGMDGSLHGCDINSGATLWEKKYSGSVEGLTCDESGKYFACGSLSGEITVANVVTGDVVFENKNVGSGVMRLLYTSSKLIAGLENAQIKIWQILANPNPKSVPHFSEDPILLAGTHTGPISALATNKFLLASLGGPGDDKLCLWRLEKVNEKRDPVQKLKYSKHGSSLCFVPDKPFIVASSMFNPNTKMYNLDTGVVEGSFLEGEDTDEYGAGTTICCDDVLVTFPEATGKLNMFNWKTKELIESIKTRTDRVVAFALTPCGNYLLTSGEYINTIIVWDLLSSCHKFILTGHKARVVSLEVHEDGTLVSGSDDKTCRVWSWVTGTEVTSCALTIQNCYGIGLVKYSSTRKRFVAAGTNKAELVVAATTATPDGRNKLFELTGNSERGFSALAISDVTGTVCAGNSAGHVHTWSIENGKPLRVFRGGHGMVTCIKFNQKFTQILSGHFDKEAVVFETKGDRKSVLRHGGAVLNVEFIDENTVVTTSEEGFARIWAVDFDNEAPTLPESTFDVGGKCNLSGLAISSLKELGAIVLSSPDQSGIHYWNLKPSTQGRECLVPDLRLIHSTPVLHMEMANNTLVAVANDIVVIHMQSVVRHGVLQHSRIDLASVENEKPKKISQVKARSKLWGNYIKSGMFMVIDALQLAAFGFSKGVQPPDIEASTSWLTSLQGFGLSSVSIGFAVGMNIFLVLFFIALLFANSKIAWRAFTRGPEDNMHKVTMALGLACGIFVGPALIPILQSLLMTASCQSGENRARFLQSNWSEYTQRLNCSVDMQPGIITMELDPCVPCQGHEFTMIVAYFFAAVMIFFAYRLVLVDNEVEKITLRRNLFDFNGDIQVVSKQNRGKDESASVENANSGVSRGSTEGGENMRAVHTPLDAFNIKYDKCKFVLKFLVLFLSTFVADPVTYAVLLLLTGACTFAIGVLFPPFHDQRGMRWVDPNCLQNGMDAAVVWVYFCGMVGAIAITQEGVTESNWASNLPVGAPFCLFFVYILIFKKKPFEVQSTRNVVTPAPPSGQSDAINSNEAVVVLAANKVPNVKGLNISFETLEEQLNVFFFNYPTWLCQVDGMIASLKEEKTTPLDLNNTIVRVFGPPGIKCLPTASVNDSSKKVPTVPSLTWMQVEQSLNRAFLKNSPSNFEGNPSKIKVMLQQLKNSNGKTLYALNKQIRQMFGTGLDIEIPETTTSKSKIQRVDATANPLYGSNEDNEALKGTNISWGVFQQRARAFFLKHSPSNLEGNPSKFDKMIGQIKSGQASAVDLNRQLGNMFGEKINLTP